LAGAAQHHLPRTEFFHVSLRCTIRQLSTHSPTMLKLFSATLCLLLTVPLTGCLMVGFNQDGKFYCTVGPTGPEWHRDPCFGTRSSVPDHTASQGTPSH
jgi:hypothetical protein